MLIDAAEIDSADWSEKQASRKKKMFRADLKARSRVVTSFISYLDLNDMRSIHSFFSGGFSSPAKPNLDDTIQNSRKKRAKHFFLLETSLSHLNSVGSAFLDLSGSLGSHW